MTDVKALQQERIQLFTDLYDGKIPKRVPINASFSIEFAIQYAQKDLGELQWNTPLLEEAFDKVGQDFFTDYNPCGLSLRNPLHYQLLGARNFVMSSSGFMQHPEVHGLEAEEYDEFIASPYDCIMEKVLPRIYKELDTNPSQRSIVFAKAFKAYYDEILSGVATAQRVNDKFGYSPIGGIDVLTEAPFDFVADQLRGFKGITGDLRRCSDKVLAAVEAVTPLMIKAGVSPKGPSKYGNTFIPLHMAPYIRPKDFEKFYWPSFKKLVDELTAMGYPCMLFVEHDWMRYIDYLYELPENTRMWFEYGDPQLVKDKLGKKHIISGFYPITLLKTGTKQQCIDKAKELVDILAPGGKYNFGFDKGIITADSVNAENLQAVLQYVGENANY
ncbi:uroporphyrinogen decarboxylase family protein [Clostridium formicaceticum]|uniref:Uroporphyrinogen decarboxylase n=1 Tax=Clostridium formicaceticum TaxID=1497 RepID=A0AAC9WHN9_9CLOT|nr:uroporphyrinogen decarboxylase family protein [Clostridium formicaceticum]AOY74771.1 uroporphyrinogen decarboxylase [Clostridium formicaceticum]ARE89161.1 Uroporphyrinogen decarboxylase (URO-D) [Clostridium formicaceticum]